MLVANEPCGRPYQVNWSTAQEEDFHSGEHTLGTSNRIHHFDCHRFGDALPVRDFSEVQLDGRRIYLFHRVI